MRETDIKAEIISQFKLIESVGFVKFNIVIHSQTIRARDSQIKPLNSDLRAHKDGFVFVNSLSTLYVRHH